MACRSRGYVFTALAVILLVLLSACSSSPSAAPGSQDSQPQQSAGSKYPDKPIIVIAPAGAGGGWDLTARTTAKVLTEEKLVPVSMPVENRTGGGGAIALEYVVNEKKGDGNTLVVYSPPLLLIHLNGTTPKSFRDLTPLAQLFTDYQIIAVKADSKYTDINQLMEDLRQNPQAVTVGGASAPGSMDHLSFMLPAFKAGVSIKDVPYVSFPGGAELTAALLGGSIEVASTGVGELVGQLEAGTIRALAITAPQRYTDPRLKDIPTLKEMGIDAEFEVWRGIFGPPDMPEDAKAFLSDALEKMVQTQAWKDALAQYNWAPAYRNAEEFAAFLESQEAQMAELLQIMGLLSKQ